MSLGIYGSSILTLDSKGRMAIPARYRDLLRQSCEGSIVVTKDPQYPSLMIYPGKLWKEISNRFEDLGGLNQKVRSMQWKILGNASVTEFEVSDVHAHDSHISRQIARQSTADVRPTIDIFIDTAPLDVNVIYDVTSYSQTNLI